MVNHHKRSLALVLDWDGTVTKRDTLHMVIERFGDLEVFDALEDDVGDRLTLDEVIAREMATITAPLDEVVEWMLEHVRLRPGFRELVAAHDPLIVSAGFHETIDPILAREGIVARVVANHVTADSAGWRSSFPDWTDVRGVRRAMQARCRRGPGRLRVRRRRGLRPVRLARGGTTLCPCAGSRPGSTSSASATSRSTISSTSCARCRRCLAESQAPSAARGAGDGRGG